MFAEPNYTIFFSFVGCKRMPIFHTKKGLLRFRVFIRQLKLKRQIKKMYEMIHNIK